MKRIAETAEQANVGKVAVFTFDFHQRLVEDALAAGVTGYLWKGLSSAELVDALQRVAAGDVVVSDPRPHTHPLDSPELSWPLRHRGLTVRESEAMALLVLGLRNREIAESMYVSVDTVKTHLRNAYRKLQVRNRAEAVADGARRRRLQPPVARRDLLACASRSHDARRTASASWRSERTSNTAAQ